MRRHLVTVCSIIAATFCIPGAAFAYIEYYADPEADTTDSTWYVTDQTEQGGEAPDSTIGGPSPHGCATAANNPHPSTAVPGAASANGATRCRLSGATPISAWVVLYRYSNGVPVAVGDNDGHTATRNYPARRVTATSKENPCRSSRSYQGGAYGWSYSFGRLYTAQAFSTVRVVC
jgi:hypothetical protein